MVAAVVFIAAGWMSKPAPARVNELMEALSIPTDDHTLK
jgi:hypothetical protein